MGLGVGEAVAAAVGALLLPFVGVVSWSSVIVGVGCGVGAFVLGRAVGCDVGARVDGPPVGLVEDGELVVGLRVLGAGVGPDVAGTAPPLLGLMQKKPGRVNPV